MSVHSGPNQYPRNPGINWNSPQANSLLGCWPLINDAAHSAKDVTGKPHSEIWTGRPPVKSFASVDGAAYEDNATNKLALDDTNGLGDLYGTSADLFISVWCRTSSTAAQQAVATDFKWTGFGDRSFTIRTEIDATWTTWWDNAAGGNGTWHTGSVTTNHDHHIVWAINWGVPEAYLYIDGVLDSTVSMSGHTAIRGGNQLYCFGDGSGSGPWTGQIWDFRVYSGVPTQSFVDLLYHYPGDLYAEDKPALFPAAAAAAGGLVIPAAMHSYRQRHQLSLG